jgi:hypothetical protein
MSVSDHNETYHAVTKITYCLASGKTFGSGSDAREDRDSKMANIVTDRNK